MDFERNIRYFLDVCPPNERYEECPDHVCKPKKCSEAGFPLNCTAGNGDKPCPGKPGCICNDGFLRDSSGVCVPRKECRK